MDNNILSPNTCFVCMQNIGINNNSISDNNNCNLDGEQQQVIIKCKISEIHQYCLDCYIKNMVLQIIHKEKFEFFQKSKIYGIKSALIHIISQLKSFSDFNIPCPCKCSSQNMEVHNFNITSAQKKLLQIVQNSASEENFLLNTILSRFRDELNQISEMMNHHSRTYITTSHNNIQLQKQIKKSTQKINKLKDIFRTIRNSTIDALDEIDDKPISTTSHSFSTCTIPNNMNMNINTNVNTNTSMVSENNQLSNTPQSELQYDCLYTENNNVENSNEEESGHVLIIEDHDTVDQ